MIPEPLPGPEGQLPHAVDAFMQARGIAAMALSDMTELLRRTSAPDPAAAISACSAALQIVAERYRSLGISAARTEEILHFAVATVCRSVPPPPGTRWVESREAGQ